MAPHPAARPRVAIILAGGRASRLDGVDKPLLEVGGRTLLSRAVDAAHRAGCTRVIVAGRERAGFADVTWVREDPPFGGPVAGLAAALSCLDGDPADGAHAATAPLDTRRVLVLPGDLVDPDAAVDALLSVDPPEGEGVCLEDPGGRSQWLTAIYPVAALRAGLRALPHGGRDASLRALIADLRSSSIPASPRATLDVDTWQDLDEARRMHGVPDESHREKDET